MQGTGLSTRAAFPHPMTELDPAEERECRECGRRDVWDADSQNWRIRDDEHAGSPYCIHDWDINGTYRPIRD